MRISTYRLFGHIAFATLAVLGMTACEPNLGSVAGRQYGIQCNWRHLTSIDFSPVVTFNEDGTFSQVDDTATWTGTYTENTDDGTVDWTLPNTSATRFRGSYDKTHLDGSMSETNGQTGTFVGNVL